jgi:predicted metal-dependent phosphotriesterase family hydrolase
MLAASREAAARGENELETICMDHPRLPQLTRREAIGLLGGGLGLFTAFGEEAASVRAQGWLTAQNATKLTFPKGAIIRTCLKDVPPEALGSGATMIHEHISLPYSAGLPGAPPPAAQAGAAALPPPPEISIELMIDELRQSAKDGLRGLIDGNATGGPRTAKQLDFVKRVAAGVPDLYVIVAGGPYKAPYPQEIVQKTADQIADDFVRQSVAQRWGAMGEIGTSMIGASMDMHPDERKALTAIAKAHARTGLPIFSHTEHVGCAKCAFDQFDLFESHGVDPKHLVIGHLSDIKPGSEPLGQTAKAIAQRGAFIGFDTVGREMRGSQNPEAGKVKYVLELLMAGYEDHLLFSSDFSPTNATYSQLKANWGNGYSSVLLQFIPKLRYAGVPDATLHKILVDNPRRFLAFSPKVSA